MKKKNSQHQSLKVVFYLTVAICHILFKEILVFPTIKKAILFSTLNAFVFVFCLVSAF